MKVENLVGVFAELVGRSPWLGGKGQSQIGLRLLAGMLGDDGIQFRPAKVVGLKPGQQYLALGIIPFLGCHFKNRRHVFWFTILFQ